MARIGDAIRDNQNIRNVTLNFRKGSNLITAIGLKEFSECLRNKKTLEVVDLCFRKGVLNINDSAMESFFEALSHSRQSLKTLILNFKYFPEF